MDALHVSINLKGTKPNKMPRISKVRGKTSAFRGISHHKVCILSAIDENDQMVFEIQGLGCETTDKVNKMEEYFKKENKTNYLITDMKQCYNKLSENTGRLHDEIKSEGHVSELGHSLADLNGLHSEFKLLYKRYRGVSIRHLQGYLDFFCFFKNLKYSIDSILKQVNQTYVTSINEKSTLKTKDIHSKEIPIDLFEAYGEYQYGCFAI